MGLSECKNQFANDKWNCSISIRHKRLSEMPTLIQSSLPLGKYYHITNIELFEYHVITVISTALVNSLTVISKYGLILLSANRETAFVHSISAAGVTYQLTEDCRRGKFENCACFKSKKSKKNWGGCNDNVRFGDILVRHFLDSIEKDNKARGSMNLHNNLVGRKVTITLFAFDHKFTH